MPIKAEIRQVWRCSFCNRPFANKANAERHEHNHCRDPKSPRVKNCKHKWDTVWRAFYLEDGSLRHEPDYDVCTQCGVQDVQVWEVNQ